MALEYTQELAESICADIASGMSVAKATKNNETSERAFYNWLAKNDQLVQNYMRAREIRADHRFESSEQLMDDLRNDVVDAGKARIMLDEIKWKCGKENAKRYGDSTQIKHADADGNKLSVSNVLGAISGSTAGLPRADESAE